MTPDKEKLRHRSRMHLIVRGASTNPDEITSILNVTPDQTWLAGDIIHEKSIMKRKDNGWKLSADVPEDNAEIGSILEFFRDRIGDKVEVLHGLTEVGNVKFYCVIEAFEARPYIGLSPDEVQFIARTGGGIDFDVYEFQDNVSA